MGVKRGGESHRSRTPGRGISSKHSWKAETCHDPYKSLTDIAVTDAVHRCSRLPLNSNDVVGQFPIARIPGLPKTVPAKPFPALSIDMATNSKRASSPTLEDDSSPKTESPMPRPVKQVKLETSIDVHESRYLLADDNTASEQDRRRLSVALPPTDIDHAAILNVMNAKIIDLEAKISQLQAPVALDSAPLINGVGQFDNIITDLVPDEPPAKRKPAMPMLNRVAWLGFKNLYPDEAVYAIDVLVVIQPNARYNTLQGLTNTPIGGTEILLATARRRTRDEGPCRSREKLQR